MKRILLILAGFVTLATVTSAQTPLKGKILKLDFSAQIAERTGSNPSIGLSGLSTSSTLSLLDAGKALERAADDNGIGLVFMTTDNYSAGVAATEELRAALARFRESGKPVIAYGTHFSHANYYLASVSDKIFMNPMGDGTFLGLSSQMYYYKDLLDSLGLNIQLIRHGKYKSAGEPYIRNDISPENREQYETMLGSIWTTLLEGIAESRGTTVETLNALAENITLHSAQTWKDNGLVDELAHRDEMEKYLCMLVGEKNVNDVKFVTLGDYARKVKNPGDKKVAVVYADGQIGEGSDISGTKMARTLAEVRDNDKIAAVVFRVNSPGGEVVASELIKREIQLLKEKKPVIASYGNYAASGGYLISSHCNRIFSDRTTLTGSIGVFGIVPSYGAALRKHIHINPVSVGTNTHSDAMTGARDLDEAELAAYQANIEKVYEDFTSSVAESRGMTVAAVDSIAQGRVWAGRDAINIGLVDEFGTLLDAIDYAASAAGLTKYGIETYPEIKSRGLRDLISSKPEKEPLVTLDIPESLKPLLEMAGKQPDRPVIYARPLEIIEIR